MACSRPAWLRGCSNSPTRRNSPPTSSPAAIPGITDVLLRAMENVYGNFGTGPASESQPSGGNWEAIYRGSSAAAPSAQGTTRCLISRRGDPARRRTQHEVRSLPRTQGAAATAPGRLSRSTACSSPAKHSAAHRPKPKPHVAAPVALCPLTGPPAPVGIGARRGPALAVKVDNYVGSPPTERSRQGRHRLRGAGRGGDHPATSPSSSARNASWSGRSARPATSTSASSASSVGRSWSTSAGSTR